MPVNPPNRAVADAWPPVYERDVVTIDDVAITVGDEASDKIQVTLQLRAGDADLGDRAAALYVLISASATALTPLADAALGTVAVDTGIEIARQNGGAILHALTDDEGELVIGITETGTPTHYLHVLMPNGTWKASSAITFA